MGARRDTAHPDLSASTIRVAVSGVEPKPAGEKAQRPNAKTRTVTTKRVEPVEPKRDSFDAGAAGTKAYRAAHEAYETRWRHIGPARSPKPAGTSRRSRSRSAREVRPAPLGLHRPEGADNRRREAEKAGVVKKPADDLDRTDKRLAARIVSMETTNGYTIKAIAHELGLPPVHRSWLKVSLVWRSEADRLGLDRPRLSPEAIKKRLSSRKEKS